MSLDPWQAWQEYVASSTPARGILQRFVDAARTYAGAATGNVAAQAEAAKSFGDAVREACAEFPLQWNAQLGRAFPTASGLNLSDQAALGATREHQQRGQRLAEALGRVSAAQSRLQLLWSDAMREAATVFAARLGALQPAAPGAEAAGKLFDLWVDCAEDAYARMAHGEAFCSTLAEFVNASSQWRRESQANLERSSAALDLPTRSELNTLARRLKAVEAQLRPAKGRRKAKP